MCDEDDLTIDPKEYDSSQLRRDNVLDHIPFLRSYARSLCQDDKMADDLVEISLIRAINSVNEFNPCTSLSKWLGRILLDCYEREGARQKAPQRPSPSRPRRSERQNF